MTRAAEHHLFFCRDIAGDTARLPVDETRHALRVLRIEPGEQLQVTDGRGRVYRCVLETAELTGAQVRIVDMEQRARVVPQVVLAVGLPERDRFEELVEHVTALGAAAVLPLVCEYCQERWWKGAWEKQAARIERKMVTAAKQSLNPFLPQLSAPRPFAEVLSAMPGSIVVAHEDGGPPDQVGQPDTVHACVGPPGGFSPAELDMLAARGARRVRLGPHRLRTELAAVALVSRLIT